MVLIHKYDPYETDLSFYCEEGNYTLETSAENEQYPKYSAQIKVGDYVALEGTSDMCVKKAGENDTIIGQVITNPEYHGDRPAQSSASGEYNRRMCTVRLFGYYAHTVELNPESDTAVNVGDAVGYIGNNLFEKADSGKTIALESAKALSGKKILVLMGLLGF